MIDISKKEVDNQETLTKERFKKLTKVNDNVSTKRQRPMESLVELMSWAREEFSAHLEANIGSDINKISTIINNKITITGAFLQFAENNDVKIEVLLKDSFVTWSSNYDNEHFNQQGVFKIKYNDLIFLQCSLFHKGNQNEDEVAFFIVVENNKFHDYVDFRNKFEKWSQERDREQLQISVIGGDSIPYDRSNNWEDLYLPDNLKNSIKGSVESFLAAKAIYAKSKIAWKRGILLHGFPGTGKSSTIKTIISQYGFKPVTVQNSSDTDDSMLTEAFNYAQEQSPGLLYLEDLDTMLSSGSITLSHFLNLMDGINSKEGIFIIATANDISLLKESITNRPSRFDRKFFFPAPDADMSKKYLEKWFGESLSKKDYTGLAKSAVESQMTYAYLKEIYLTSVFNAMADNRETPTIKDVKFAMEQMKNDKELADNGFEEENNNKIGV